ncbi:unnamed protein product [Toxocara canis]|uniref:WD_REPEATS_REGION domain-containing protein n=1 Tax=Toxocara canis TaxID=6265 RepID=A0A183UMS5_TOXCA|nr:unnamed protein product [Toxocara canis]
MNAKLRCWRNPFLVANATAADNDAFGKCICLEGSRCLTVVEAEKYGATPSSIKTTRHEVSILRWQKLNNAEGRLIASVSGQYVDIYSVAEEGITAVSTVRVHPLNVTDVDWCAYDVNSFVTCSIDDAINVWDVRDVRRARMQLHVVAGAEQAKWAPHAQHYLCTSHGTDIRLWDIRNVSSPLQSIPAHLQKMCCVVWHPTDPLCFVTTSLDGYIKMWNFADLTKPRHSIGMLPAPVWKLKFSFDGEEFASIPLPQRGIQTSKNTLNVWRTGELDNAQAMKCDDDVILDVCWQKSQSRRRSFKYLYSISRSGKLRRYPLSPCEVATNSVDITTPIPVDSTGRDGDRLQEVSFPMDVGLTVGQMLEHSLSVTGGSCPHLGGDLTRFDQILSDILRCIMSLCVFETLELLQVDFAHSTVALSYVHYASNKKLRLMVHFHANFENNGRVCLEVVEQDSPLSKEQAAQLLELLNEQTAGFTPTITKTTVLACALKQLPDIIDSMKVFLPKSIDIPRVGNASELRGGCVSVEAGHVAPRSLGSETPKASSLKSGCLSPSQFRSMFDKWVPSPRTCGAQFNGSGLFVVFGPVAFSKHKEVPKTKKELKWIKEMPKTKEELKWASTENNKFDLKKGRSIRRSPRPSGCEIKEKEAAHDTPRSLDDYNQEQLAAYAQNASHSWQHATPSEQEAHSPSSTVAFYAQFVNTTGLVGGNPPQGIVPPLLKTANSVSRVVAQKTSKTSTSSMTSARSRSFSIQNAPLSLVAANRNRGNSLTGVLADDHYQPAEGAPYSTVTVYDVCGLMSVSKPLARRYRLVGKSALELCLWNMQVVDEEGRKDLLKIWKIVELCVRSGRASWRRQCSALRSERLPEQNARDAAQSGESCESSDEDDGEGSWAVHPFGRNLVNSFPRIKRDFDALETQQYGSNNGRRRQAQHARSNSDTENMGGFAGHSTIPVTPTRENYRKLEESLKAVLQPTEKEKRSATLSVECERAISAHSPPGRIASFFSSARPKLSRRFHLTSETNEIAATRAVSNSTRLYDGSSAAQNGTFEATKTISDEQAAETSQRKEINSLLDPALNKRLDDVRHQYGDLLFRWRMYSKWAEVMKYSENAPVALPLWSVFSLAVKIHCLFPARSKCGKCGYKCERGFCARCNSQSPPLLCALCRTPVKGLVTACAMCHHGGHSEHMLAWFQMNSNCPCGCGCECKATGF